MYVGLTCASAIFIFTNTITMKYNRDTMCSADFYNDAVKNVTQNGGGVFMSYFHYLLTMLNILAYIASISAGAGLWNKYERKKLVNIKNKLKPA